MPVVIIFAKPLLIQETVLKEGDPLLVIGTAHVGRARRRSS
jgi:hypothetical protein